MDRWIVNVAQPKLIGCVMNRARLIELIGDLGDGLAVWNLMMPRIISQNNPSVHLLKECSLVHVVRHGHIILVKIKRKVSLKRPAVGGSGCPFQADSSWETP